MSGIGEFIALRAQRLVFQQSVSLLQGMTGTDAQHAQKQLLKHFLAFRSRLRPVHEHPSTPTFDELAMQALLKAKRLATNILMDLRYGGFLGGKPKASPFSHLGAHDSGNSDYGLTQQIFAGRILPDDILVDVGCGKGRVINCWLSLGLTNRMYGLELDPELAERTARRLRRRPNVSILAGDAINNLPADGTVFYLFNPFNKEVMSRFRDRILEGCTRPQRLAIFYYAPVFIEVFRDDQRWTVEMFEVDMSQHVSFSPRHRTLALIRPKLSEI